MKNCPTFEVYFISVVNRSKHFFNQREKFSYIDINKIGLFDPNNCNSRLSCWLHLNVYYIFALQFNIHRTNITKGPYMFASNFYFYFYYITSQSLYSITRRIRISRLTTTPGSTTPTLYEQCVGSLTSHSINIGKDCETGPTVFRPYPRRLESLTICRCHYKGSTFFSVIVKTLSVGPAGAWTRDLLLNRPVLSRLS